MLRFKRETGKEVTEIKGDISDLCTYLWCCVASASKHDGMEFSMTLMDFADSISPEDVQAWAAVLNEGAEEAQGDEKKVSRHRRAARPCAGLRRAIAR